MNYAQKIFMTQLSTMVWSFTWGPDVLEFEV